MPPAVLTIGHSNHPLDRFLALLTQHQVEALVDIRRFPGSRKHPHFHRDSLAATLPKSGVEYHWLEALGGRRHKGRGESPNRGLENKGFRNYADYMLSDEFRERVEKLLEIARQKRAAIMCAEGLFWQCHRRLVSDFLVANGVTVKHIMPTGELRPHKLTSGAVIESGRVTCPSEKGVRCLRPSNRRLSQDGSVTTSGLSGEQAGARAVPEASGYAPKEPLQQPPALGRMPRRT